MNRFYSDIESLNHFTLSLDCWSGQVECKHCHKSGQLVSHGFTYKQLSSAEKIPVGKRVFCSNRYGRSGCGKTLQLYIAQRFPFFRYCAAALFVFLSLLILGRSVNAAYQSATDQQDVRQGWRWLNRLMLKLTDFRQALANRKITSVTKRAQRSRRLQLLLTTVNALFAQWRGNPCASFQHAHQVSFI